VRRRRKNLLRHGAAATTQACPDERALPTDGRRGAVPFAQDLSRSRSSPRPSGAPPIRRAIVPPLSSPRIAEQAEGTQAQHHGAAGGLRRAADLATGLNLHGVEVGLTTAERSKRQGAIEIVGRISRVAREDNGTIDR
jgi:hypothetical protein